VADNYYFCANKGCSTGYFSLTGQVISKQLLKSNNDIQTDKLCYCFDIDTAQYITALQNSCAEPIKNFVIEKTQLGYCACEIRNPSGQCCLACFKILEKQYNTEK